MNKINILENKRICIVNRGEIACRIIKSIHKLGMQAVALYSEQDKNAKHMQMADEAFYLGAAAAKKSYLNVDRILEILKQSKVDALHPGYGFLSENAAFAQAVMDLGILWIGPSVENIKCMGKKDTAIQIAKSSKVSVLEGSESFNTIDLEQIIAKAKTIGFPMLIKAVSGGGGIGMKCIYDEEELKIQALSTSKMAQSAFGDGRIYLEKYIEQARHIEVQVFGLKDKVLHFYERDCSIQRRFQKIIEETHAPQISKDKIVKIIDDALKITNYINYQGAGTVEFIYDIFTKKHYFLEVNTRIQVEHPITEECTNIDLIELQIKFAFGLDIGLNQDDIMHEGHSIECRLYAENPAMNFLPSPGTIKNLSFAKNDGIRIDSGVRSGDTISFHYDPMIAKIISKGKTREEAIDKMQKALNETTIQGIKTNLELLKKIIALEDFVQGNLHTKFIQDHAKQIL